MGNEPLCGCVTITQREHEPVRNCSPVHRQTISEDDIHRSVQESNPIAPQKQQRGRTKKPTYNNNNNNNNNGTITATTSTTQRKLKPNRKMSHLQIVANSNPNCNWVEEDIHSINYTATEYSNRTMNGGHRSSNDGNNDDNDNDEFSFDSKNMPSFLVPQYSMTMTEADGDHKMFGDSQIEFETEIASTEEKTHMCDGSDCDDAHAGRHYYNHHNHDYIHKNDHNNNHNNHHTLNYVNDVNDVTDVTANMDMRALTVDASYLVSDSEPAMDPYMSVDVNLAPRTVHPLQVLRTSTEQALAAVELPLGFVFSYCSETEVKI